MGDIIRIWRIENRMCTSFEYKTDYFIDGDSIPLILSYYSTVNNTFDHCFGTEKYQDDIEDISFSIDFKSFDFNWLKIYSVEQLENRINNDCDFIQKESEKIKLHLEENRT